MLCTSISLSDFRRCVSRVSRVLASISPDFRAAVSAGVRDLCLLSVSYNDTFSFRFVLFARDQDESAIGMCVIVLFAYSVIRHGFVVAFRRFVDPPSVLKFI